jgi:hypothetical protein
MFLENKDMLNLLGDQAWLPTENKASSCFSNSKLNNIIQVHSKVHGQMIQPTNLSLSEEA